MSSDKYLSPSSSFRQSSASKIDQLYEITYVSDDSKIPISQMPMVNPYQVFAKPSTSLSRKVKQLIGSTPNKQIKEYVQASKFDSHQLPASQTEHLVPLCIPQDLPRHCLSQGYTHIHFGAIRLALTFHGRKGLPAYSRIALLDTRFVEYQHACIGTIQTTLNAGTVFVTFYPNFNMPLNDPSLFTALKAQIQIGGTPQVNTFQATFHYQMAYRVQNHSLDIMVPGQENAGEALYIDIDSNATPTCTYIPKQLSRDELVKLLPERWVTNYEQIHQAPVRTTTAPEFIRHENGLVELKFSSPRPINESPSVFPTGIHMIEKVERPGKHIEYDVCNCEDCLEEAYKVEMDEDIPKKRNSSQQRLKRRYENGDPSVGLLGEHSGKFDYYVLYSDKITPPPQPCNPLFPSNLSPYHQQALSIIHKDKVLHPSPFYPTTSQPPQLCYPITQDPSSSDMQEYLNDFPPLKSFEFPEHRTRHDWKIKTPTTISPTGAPSVVSQAEATLNWQSENAVAQNKVLVKILSQQNKLTKTQDNLSSKVRSLESIIHEVRFKIQELHRDLIQTVRNPSTSQTAGSLSQKEAEMKTLKTQLQDLERQHRQKRISTLVDDPWRLPSTPFVGVSFDPQPIPQSPLQNPSPSLNLWAAEQEKIKPKKKGSCGSQRSTSNSNPSYHESEFFSESPIVASSKAPNILPIEKVNPISSFLKSLAQEKEPKVPTFVGPITESDDFEPIEAFEHLFMTEAEPETAESTVQFDPEDYEPPPQERSKPAPRSDIKQKFTFDDIPPSKWRERSVEMLTWCSAELQYYSMDMVIKRFLTRLQGRLRDWYLSLGEYRQLQIQQASSPEEFMNIIYSEFIGSPYEHTIHAREEFLKMKCCSFQKKDLEKHYDRMSQRFYCLSGVDDVNLKQVFLNSFPESLGNEAYRSLEARNITIAQSSLGDLYQLILNALAKLCNQKKFLVEFEKTGKRLGSACDDRYLQIKCKDKSSCDCTGMKKKSHYKKFPKNNHYKSFKKNSNFSRKRKWKFVKRKSQRGKTSDKCYICQKEGHFAKNCPNKRRSQALIQMLSKIEPVDISDLESLYSLDDEPGEDALCSIGYSDYSSDEDSESYSSDEHSDLEMFMINPLPHILPIQESPPTPLAKIHILTDTYAIPIPVIAFFDTGAAVSILDPKILPARYWKPHRQDFLAANGERFVIDKISIPISIRLFPKCVIKQRFLGTNAPGKDMIIGFDILHRLSNLKWSKEGLCYKSFINRWTSIPRIFIVAANPIEEVKREIIKTSCASSHTEFLKKHSSPLWLNPSFFVSLPFKQNEDVNPTKASHPGMNPDHYKLAIEECTQLVDQKIIEPTTSPWACEAFYVNKRSEQVRGKLRLVINYQPLNHFLADDKFPLPQKRSLFQSLVNAKVLSKFDLKSGFWQLGIHPNDRSKTAFCIPDHHYQWNVMPFGLKNAPSAFQKAMVTIFEPILANTLVYIDDILLFSPDEKSHVELLAKFHSLVNKYGIMLSEKKMEVGVSTIDFLGMKISDGKYQPQPHIAQELHKFPDELSTQKMVQQFLGLVNYMSDFLPKLSNHTVWLFPMLKKNHAPWTTRQTTAVKEIKKLADMMPPLKIPDLTERRIIQTDASDEYWGAVLIVENSKKERSICGYKSGTFKKSEKHYHSTFKEILAVKRGIEKFQFHLVGHEFQIEMDMSSFPRMLQFKRKSLPQAQLLRWSNWFSQWKFTVKHIKGTDNVLADFLSRPTDYKASSGHKGINQAIPMVYTITGKDGETSSTTTEPETFPVLQLPDEVAEIIADLTFKERGPVNYKTFLTILLKKHGTFMKGLKFHPDYPFLNIFHVHDLYRFPKEALCFFWYLFESHTIAISFNAPNLLAYMFKCQFETVPQHTKYLFTMLQWFLPHHQWTRWLTSCSTKPYLVVVFRRPNSFIPPTTIFSDGSIVYHSPYCFILDWYKLNPSSLSCATLKKEVYIETRSTMARANGVDPSKVPFFIMHNIHQWSDDHPDSAKWIQATNEWKQNHLEAMTETSDEMEDYMDWEEDNDPYEHDHNDPYEDDPTHPDARWSP